MYAENLLICEPHLDRGKYSSNDLFEIRQHMQNRLKELRKAKGLTLEALAKRVRSSNQQISNLENGKRRLNLDWIERLAEALGCHPFELLADQPLPRTREERLLLELFRDLNGEQRRAVLRVVASVAKPGEFEALTVDAVLP